MVVGEIYFRGGVENKLTNNLPENRLSKLNQACLSDILVTLFETFAIVLQKQ